MCKIYIMVNKIYVWNNVLTDYTSGMAVAIAPTKEDAIKLLLQEFTDLKSAYDDQKNWNNNVFQWEKIKSDVGTLSLDHQDLINQFENDLYETDCYICNINHKFAIFKGGGS